MLVAPCASFFLYVVEASSVTSDCKVNVAYTIHLGMLTRSEAQVADATPDVLALRVIKMAIHDL